MSINLNVNGSDYQFPEPNDEDWGQDVTDWAAAITTGTIQKEGGDVSLINDLDLGLDAGIISNYFKSRSVDIADNGILRLSNTDTIEWRNSTNDGNNVLSLDGDTLKFNGEAAGYRFLSELEDVTLTTPVDKEYLVYNGVEWLNKQIEINDISEIVVTTATTKDVLYYDGIDFVNKSIELNDIDNVVISTPNSTEFVGFDGINFVNKEVKFNDITEVNVNNPSVNDYLYYDGNTWTNKPFSIDEAVEEVIRTEVGNITNDLTGFPNRTDTTISFDDVAKSVTIDPVGSEFITYHRGVEIVNTTPLTLNYSQTSGGRYIDIDPITGNLIEKGSIPSIMDDLLCFYVYYNATSDVVVIKGDERHSSYRDTTWHRSKHLEDGMVLRSGGAVSYTLADPTNVSIGISTPLVVADEDLEHSIQHNDTPTNNYEQILDGVAEIPVIYLDSTGYFTQDTPTTVPCKLGTSNIAYNSIVGGVGSQVDVDDGKYVNYFIVVTNCTKYPVKAIQGRNQFDSIDDAQAETLEALGLPFPELVPIQQIVLKVDTTIIDNPYKVTFEAVFNPVRNLGSNTSISADNHETLSGRTKENSHPASAISTNGITGIVGNNVQEHLEDIVTGDVTFTGTKTFNGTINGTAVSTNPTATTVPVRDANGTFKVGEPTESEHPIRKQEFDELLSQPWNTRAIGEEIWLDDSNPAVDVPPTDNPSFRYIKLTAGENGSGHYNEGILINEIVSGSAPLIEATAEINLPSSPFHGQVVRLLNTERRFVRAGESGVVQDDQMQKITGVLGYVYGSTVTEGAFTSTSISSRDYNPSYSTIRRSRYILDSSNSPDARTSETTDGETRPRNIGRTIYMRIL